MSRIDSVAPEHGKGQVGTLWNVGSFLGIVWRLGFIRLARHIRVPTKRSDFHGFLATLRIFGHYGVNTP